MNKLIVALSALAAGFTASAKPSFYLPERIFAAPGIELNVYYKDVFDSVVPQNYAYVASCRKGKSELTRWCFTPAKEDAGKEYRLVINAWNDEGRVACVTSVVEVAATPKDPARRVTLALFGDSLTNCGFQNQILKVMQECGYTGYEPVGSRASITGGAKHDGYGGYTFNTFFNNYRVSEEEVERIQDAAEREQLKALGVPVKIVHAWQRSLLRSPLVKFENGQKIVDVKAWLEKVNGGAQPDYVLIELGVNSVFGYVGDAAALRDRLQKEVIPDAKNFIARLRQDMPDSVYLLCTQPVGTSQDGYAANYGSTYNEVQLRKTLFALNREYDAMVKEMNDPKVRLLPLGHSVDPYGGYIQSVEPINARSKVKRTRQVNAVHLSAEGGLQMGDTIAAALMVDLGK